MLWVQVYVIWQITVAWRLKCSSEPTRAGVEPHAEQVTLDCAAVQLDEARQHEKTNARHVE